MTTLILDVAGYNIPLPESRKGGYYPRLEPLSVDVEMISGRLTRELRGNVWWIDYKYGYFDEETKNTVIMACEKGKRAPIECTFLSQNGNEMLTRTFWVMNFQYPTFYWGKAVRGERETKVPMWGDFAISLREVKPSD